MIAKILLVEWKEDIAKVRQRELNQMGLVVDIETSDLARGLKRLERGNYDAVVLGLDSRPERSLQFGKAMRQHKKTREIPSVFVDGSPDWQKMLKDELPQRGGLKVEIEGAEFVTNSENLAATLRGLQPHVHRRPWISRQRKHGLSHRKGRLSGARPAMGRHA
jgi:CheY-like chemotaxis protein